MFIFEDKLKKIIISCSENQDLKPEDINMDVDLVRDYNFNSISIITLVVEIERNFDIEIDDEDLLLDKISPYCNLCEMLKKKLNKTSRKNYVRGYYELCGV